MALTNSPRKVVPLASGDDWEPSQSRSGPGITKRVFFCGVVVENSDSGRRLPQDVQDLVVSLGEPLDSNSKDKIQSLGESSSSEPGRPGQRKRALTNSSALAEVINELVTTERSYVKRLQSLKYDYADPLRKFSRHKDTAILQPYEAKTLFGNVDNLLPVNEAFLADLEKILSAKGAASVGGVGDVVLHHFKTIRGFEHYKQYYIKREEAQAIFEREVAKRSSGFAAFIDRIKYSSADTRNRVGLRELLMDPVQRIPRYTLLFRTMIKHMAPTDPQRIKLVEADEIASKIAHAETDEQTKRATIMYCLSATVEGFPPGLISNSRRFVDCIDVEDVASDGPPPTSGPPSSAGSLHCTLFLFDDKLVIVKRPGNGEKGGKVLAGLDEVEKVTKAGGLPLGMKKSGMTCKGVVDVTDVVVTDVGGADFHLYLENPPTGQSDRWSDRPFRSMAVVFPPNPVYLDPTRTEAEKKRFLENLWNVQAMYRTKLGQSVALCAEEREVESRAGRTTVARAYFNVYQRTAFLQEVRKTKIVVQIDALGSADPIPFGVGAPPYVVVRVQPMAGELSRYTVTSSDPGDEGEEDIVQTARVPSRIVHTTHQYALFKFRTGNNSLPSTPAAGLRTRSTIFGLDAISRNLFNARPGSTKDFFGGSINNHRRTKSTTSRTSTYTQSTSTNDGSLMRFSHRSNSTATQATTVSTMDDTSTRGSKTSRSRKLLKRGKSPGPGSESERSPSRGGQSPGWSRESSVEPDYSDMEDESTIAHGMDLSEMDLARRLELARRNSQNQHGKSVTTANSEKPSEETIYEETIREDVRPPSRASRDAVSHRSTTPQPESRNSMRPGSPRSSRSDSRHSTERRPIGPRCPSPLPPSKSPVPPVLDLPSMDVDLAMETPFDYASRAGARSPGPSVVSPMPRSKRQPFVPTQNTEATPKPINTDSSATPMIEPLSIKKKNSGRSAHGPSTPTRRAHPRLSPMAKTKTVSPRRASPQVRSARSTVSSGLVEGKGHSAESILHLVQSGKDEVNASMRAVKRMKLEVDDLRNGDHSEGTRSSSPEKATPGTPRRGNALTKEAQSRMEEMRQMFEKRGGDGTPRPRSRSLARDEPAAAASSTIQAFTGSMDVLFKDVDSHLDRASCSQTKLQGELELVLGDIKERALELDKARFELQNTKRQCELVKSLLADATAEKDIMYEAFNEELDGMYNDANLPDDEAWIALSRDLRQAKEARNGFSKENSQLKRKLAEIESQKEEWGELLRAHGLIP